MPVINLYSVSISLKKYSAFIAGNIVTSILLLGVLFLIPEPAQAGSLARICTATGNCGVCDIVATFVTVGKWLMTGAAGLALIVMVNAGITMITAAGNAEKIGAAKKHILWAVLGTIITYAAFTLVSVVILFMVTPSNLLDYGDEGQAKDYANLSIFLGGTAWYNICNEKDLQNFRGEANESNVTASCLFWGDGTPCSPLTGNEGDPISICYQGSCVSPALNNDLQECINPTPANAKTCVTKTFTQKPVTNPITGKPIQFVNACDYLAQVDPLYADYSCVIPSSCEDGTIEEGFCPGPTYCCKSKEIPKFSFNGIEDGEYSHDEAVAQLAGTVAIKTECLTQGQRNCVTLDGIKKTTINIVNAIAANCTSCVSNEIVVTGGTETFAHTGSLKGHWYGYAIDLRAHNNGPVATNNLNSYMSNLMNGESSRDFDNFLGTNIKVRILDERTGSISNYHWHLQYLDN